MAKNAGKAKKNSQIKAVLKRLRKNKSAMFGLAVFVVVLAVALFAPLIAPYGYEEMDLMNTFATPSWKHLCGTDKLGRDILSRLIYGARYSIILGLGSQAVQLLLGTSIGCLAGYYGGKADNIIMRLMDIMQALPGLLLSIVVSTALGTGLFNTILAMGIGGVPMACRLIRAQILTIRDKEYLEAAASINCSTPRQIFRYILPNAISPLIVSTTMGIGSSIMLAASLSYIGLGVQPPTPEWGAMLVSAKDQLRYYPHLILFPGLCIALVVLSLNVFGDGLRDAMDPKLKT